MPKESSENGVAADRFAESYWGWVSWGLKLKLVALGLLALLFLAMAAVFFMINARSISITLGLPDLAYSPIQASSSSTRRRMG